MSNLNQDLTVNSLIWVRSLDKKGKVKKYGMENYEWLNIKEIADQFTPEPWRSACDAKRWSGHGGGDYFVFEAFAAAVQDGVNRLDVHAAMDMTLPGLISQQSIAQNGVWFDVPDSRTW